jgi:hypothetical protein
LYIALWRWPHDVVMNWGFQVQAHVWCALVIFTSSHIRVQLFWGKLATCSMSARASHWNCWRIKGETRCEDVWRKDLEGIWWNQIQKNWFKFHKECHLGREQYFPEALKARTKVGKYREIVFAHYKDKLTTSWLVGRLLNQVTNNGHV